MDEISQVVTQVEAALPGPVRFRDTNPSFQISSVEEIAFALWLMIDMEVDEKAELRATISAEPLTFVEIRYDQSNEGPPIGPDEVAVVAASIQKVPEPVRSEFEQHLLNQAYLRDGHLTYRSEPYQVENIWELGTDSLEPAEFTASPELLAIRNSVAGELSRVGKLTANWLWWRCSGRGELTLRQGPLYWSPNGREWLLVPTGIANYREMIPSIKIDEGVRQDFVSLNDQTLEKRLGRELLREAWRLMHSQPRSALLIAVAAAEVGFKEWASEVAPDTAWLLETIQSPPINKLLGEFLPMLSEAKCGVRLPAAMSKQHIVKIIRDGAEARNTIAHSLPSSAKYQKAARLIEFKNFDEFQELLLCVSDLLWILDFLWLRSYDYEAGWALERVRLTTRSSLGLGGHSA